MYTVTARLTIQRVYFGLLKPYIVNDMLLVLISIIQLIRLEKVSKQRVM